jgi:hypothetical protein
MNVISFDHQLAVARDKRGLVLQSNASTVCVDAANVRLLGCSLHFWAWGAMVHGRTEAAPHQAITAALSIGLCGRRSAGNSASDAASFADDGLDVVVRARGQGEVRMSLPQAYRLAEVLGRDRGSRPL